MALEPVMPEPEAGEKPEARRATCRGATQDILFRGKRRRANAKHFQRALRVAMNGVVFWRP